MQINQPDELIIENESITDSENIAKKLKAYFASVADILNENISAINTCDLDTEKIEQLVVSKVPENTHFTIPLIYPEKSNIVH